MALLEVKNLGKNYTLPDRSSLRALCNVSFTLHKSKNLGIVGESGSGKSTLAKLVMALEKPSTGEVWFNGNLLAAQTQAQLLALRPNFQMVFQDPFSSLDPRQTILKTVCEPLRMNRDFNDSDLRQHATQALIEVGLKESDLVKYPHEFSGGQRQRIALARALVTRPSLIVADEPVSALDVSVQAQVLNLMQDLQERLGLSYLFISHDLAVVDLLCDDVIVLKNGEIVEQGPTDQLFNHAQHSYTKALLDSIPGLGNAPSSSYEGEMK